MNDNSRKKIICVRFTEDEFETISKISNLRKEAVAKYLRDIILQNLQQFEKTEQFKNHQAIGKYSLMRAERQAIMLNFMTNMMMRELLPENRHDEILEKANKLAEKGWHYELDKEDSPLSESKENA